jgi:hypothetical protein
MELSISDNNTIKIRSIINHLITIIENLLDKIEAGENQSKNMSCILNNLHKFISIMNNFSKLQKGQNECHLENLTQENDEEIIAEFLKNYTKHE